MAAGGAWDERATAGRLLLGANLRRLRLAADLTLSDVAEASGISVALLSEVERGRKNPQMDFLDRYATALGCLVVDLLDGVYPYGTRRRPRRTPTRPPDGRLRQT